ncbi:MAG: D-sedoheptulose-7-phosphate isomerase [Planctomycetota bacterium]
MSLPGADACREALLAGARLREQAAETLAEKLAEVADAVGRRLAAGGTVYLFGNGGSAAQALHFAAEITGRYKLERSGFAAVALGTNPGEVTAIANDYGYEQVFSRPLQALIAGGDVAVGLTGSGGSANVVRGLEVARKAGALTVAFTGASAGADGGPVGRAAELTLTVPAEGVAEVQEVHLALGHVLCELVERQLAAEEGS